jgi:hypothetical protein
MNSWVPKSSCACLAWAVVSAALVGGCASSGLPRAAVPAYIIVPHNIMVGGLWDVDPLMRQELEAFFMQRLPSAEEAPELMSELDVFEKFCGKRVVWIPPEYRPRSVWTYRKLMMRHRAPDKGVSVGEYLESILDTYVGHGFLPYGQAPGDKATLVGGVWVALVTKEQVLMILVPRDYTRPSLPPIPAMENTSPETGGK